MTTLHIIGNGFDLGHGIDSKYTDFKKYAWKHDNHGYFLGLLETCYPDMNPIKEELELWCDLESALGNPDIKAAFQATTEDIEMEEEHEGRHQAEMEDAPGFFLSMMFESFHSIFEEWVNQIDINVDRIDNIPHFDSHGLFFSFNYTDTLEFLYNIPRDHINYIHGRRNSTDRLIVGHCNDVNGNEQLSADPIIYEYQAYENIAKLINEEQKKVSDIINSNSGYWNSLINVDRVVVYGHSLSNVDLPYFGKIKNSVWDNAEWYISIFYQNSEEKQKEVEKVKNFITSMGLEISRCHTFVL